MMGAGPVTFRHDCEECLLDRLGSRARGEPGPVRDTEHMGVDCDGGFAVEGIQDHIGAFAADAGELKEVLAASGDLAAEPIENELRACEEVPGLVPEESEPPEPVLEPPRTQGDHGFWSRCNPEERFGDAIDFAVGRLG